MERINIFNFNKYIILAFILIVSFIGFNSKAFADETDLPFDQTVSGELTDDVTSNDYTINVTESGRITFDLNSYVDSSTSIKLVDENDNEVFSDSVDGSPKNPAQFNNWVDLDSGIYHLSIYNGDDYSTGEYTIKTSFIPAKNNEIEPNNGTVEAQSLDFGQTVTGFLSWGDTNDVYKLTVPKAGRVSVDLSSYVDSTTCISLIDEATDEKIWDGEPIDSSSKNPAKYDNWVDLEPGTYYLQVYNYDESNSNTGKYFLKTSIVTVNNNDLEPNNGIVEAQPLSFYNKLTGFLSWNDSVDIYKINVPKNGEVDFGLTSYVDSITFITLLNKNNDEIFSDIVDGSSKNPAKFLQKQNLSSGTYYLKVYYDHEVTLNTGKYVINVSAPYLLPSIKLDQIHDKTQTVTGTTGANQQVTVYLAGEVYTGKADGSGHFYINIPMQKAGTKVDVSVENSYGTKKTTVTVLDRTAPAAPTVGKVTTKSKYVTGKAESGATIYIYKGSKKIRSAKVTSKGTYQAQISTQKKGSILKVYVQDSAGNKSKTIQVKVQ
ncbi:Ig-like domain-containing protein [Neobacillus niacini]|uniref:Ig-like domain-containing protein n=1 Tax=Neobacillus niacini TaxID=86668 RepID=UPI002859D1C9|nr:Ig-like domain-containing protein [Neobacillus niacini]MDR7000089.1 hypothetical protein [Neobacillus niacini]